jgi:hypothetical protein
VEMSVSRKLISAEAAPPASTVQTSRIFWKVELSARSNGGKVTSQVSHHCSSLNTELDSPEIGCAVRGTSAPTGSLS